MSVYITCCHGSQSITTQTMPDGDLLLLLIVYLADMKLLEMTAPEVYAEFMQGNFVVKRTKRRFNQVPADQATEWINKTCKMQNGIIGITRNDQTREKFCDTWAERSRISQDTQFIFNLEDEEEVTAFLPK